MHNRKNRIVVWLHLHFFTKGYDIYLDQANSELVLSTEGTACFDPVSSAGKHREHQHSRQDTK